MCTAPNNCTCHKGYKKTNESSNVCEPICRSDCENGRCSAPDTCTCNEGYHMSNESKCEPVCTEHCYNGVDINNDYISLNSNEIMTHKKLLSINETIVIIILTKQKY